MLRPTIVLGEAIRNPRPTSVNHFIDPGSGRSPRPDDIEPCPFDG